MFFKTKPWDHQSKALEFLRGKSSALLHMDMGTGKTKVVIDYIQNFMVNRPRPATVLILCPKPVISVWPGEFKKHCGIRHNIYPLDRHNWSVARKTKWAEEVLRQHEDYGKSPVVFVLNFEAAIHEPFQSFSIKQQWDLVVLDESHRIKAPFGKTSKYCSKLRKNAYHRLCLTGTPLPHNAMDIFAQFRFLQPDIFGYSYTKFKSRYGIWGGYQNHEFKGVQNEAELSSKMAEITYQVKADDVLDLPEAHHICRPVNLLPKTRRIYKSMEDDFVTWAANGEQASAANALVKLLRLQQITSGYLHDDTGEVSAVGSEKKEVLEDVLRDLPADEPLVVFCKFTHDINLVHAVAEKLGRKSLELSGRNNHLSRWQEGEAPILATQIQAGSIGVDFTRARYAVYYSLGYSLGEYEQSLARLRRPGAKRSITYFHLIASETVDEKVYKALSERKNAVTAILDEVKRTNDLWSSNAKRARSSTS